MSRTTPHRLPDRIRVRQVLDLAWPIIISMLSFTAMSVADSIFVAQLGTAYVGAVGLAAVAMFTLHGFGNGVLSGFKVAVAQSHGADDDATARRLGWQALWLGLVMGGAEAAFYPLAGPFFALQGASPQVEALAASYFEVRVLGAPLAFAMYAAASYFQGRGQTRLPMVVTLVSNGMNIALDPLLIFGFGPIPPMGVAGAAWATVIAYAVGSLVLVALVVPQLRQVSARPDAALLRAGWRLGAPMGVRATLEVGSYLLFASVLAMVGDDHLAAHVIVLRVISVSFLPGYGIGEAAAILTGQAVGAGRTELIGQIRRAGTRLAVGFMVGCGVLFLVAGAPVAAVFNPSPSVLAITLDLFLIAAAFQIFDARLMVSQGVLNGIGDTRFVMISGVACAWLVKMPVGWLLAVQADLGAPGAWVGLTVEIVVVMVICRLRLDRGKWRAALPRAVPAG